MSQSLLRHQALPRLTHALSLLLIAIALAVPGANAAANPAVIDSITIEQLHSILKDEGYAVSIDEDGDLLWKIEGYRTYLVVSDEGEYVQFQSSFEDTDATLETVNEWNKTKRYSRSYLDDDKDPILELDLDLEGGVTRERINSFLKTCSVSFRGWLKEVID